MSVVINDFEVLPDPSDDGTSADDEESAAPKTSSLRPMDIVEVVDRAERRRRRLRAH